MADSFDHQTSEEQQDTVAVELIRRHGFSLARQQAVESLRRCVHHSDFAMASFWDGVIESVDREACIADHRD